VDRATGVIYTLALTLDRVPIPEQVQRLLEAFERWRPLKIGIETTGYQQALLDTLADASRKQRLYLPLEPIRSTRNKQARILGTVSLYQGATSACAP